MDNKRSCRNCGFSLDTYGYVDCPRCLKAPQVLNGRNLKRIVHSLGIFGTFLLWIVLFIVGILNL